MNRDAGLLGVGAILGTAVGYGLARLWSIDDNSEPQVAIKGSAAQKGDRRAPQYHSGVIKAKPEMMEQYTQLHDHTWNEVMERMHEANMRNFVVYYHKELQLMFHHWEYIGDDFKADMAKCSNDPIVNFWWTHCEPCQEPLHWQGPPPSQGGHGHPDFSDEWWSPMVQLNHCGGWSTSWSSSWPDPDFKPQNPHGNTSSLHNTSTLVHNRPAGWTTPENNPFLPSCEDHVE